MLKLRSFDKWYLTEDMSYWTSFAVIQRWFLSFLHPVGYTDVLLCAFSYNVKARWINSYFSHSANLPTGLYILPSVISFFFIFNDFSETNYLKIRWTDFHNLFTEWKRFGVQMIDLDLFFGISRDVAMATNFGQNLRHDLNSAPWHFNMDALSSCGCAH